MNVSFHSLLQRLDSQPTCVALTLTDPKGMLEPELVPWEKMCSMLHLWPKGLL